QRLQDAQRGFAGPAVTEQRRHEAAGKAIAEQPAARRRHVGIGAGVPLAQGVLLLLVRAVETLTHAVGAAFAQVVVDIGHDRPPTTTSTPRWRNSVSNARAPLRPASSSCAQIVTQPT